MNGAISFGRNSGEEVASFFHFDRYAFGIAACTIGKLETLYAPLIFSICSRREFIFCRLKPKCEELLLPVAPAHG